MKPRRAIWADWAGALALVLLFAIGQVADQFDAWRARTAGALQAAQDSAWVQGWQQRRATDLAAYQARVAQACGVEAVCTAPRRTGTASSAGVCTTRRGAPSTLPCPLPPQHLQEELQP